VDKASTVKRESHGKWAKGTPSPNPTGRRPRTTETEYHDAIVGVTPIDEWIAVARAALEAAKKNDAKARDWLSQYLLPTPDALAALRAQQNPPTVPDPHFYSREMVTTTTTASAPAAPPTTVTT